MKKVIIFGLLLAVVFTGCKESEEDDDNDGPEKIGIMGEWYSSGDNVAPLLIAAGIDSLYAEFNVNNTYLVESFSEGSKTTLTGTFTQEKSGTGNIWVIALNQNTPNSLTSEGIFEVTDGTPKTMKYEVAQTEPPISGVTKPTAAGGFGSTSEGAYGEMNVQNYIQYVK